MKKVKSFLQLVGLAITMHISLSLKWKVVVRLFSMLRIDPN